MPALIERGHLFIAQPPLYKIKKGKKEVYIQNDQEMEEYLLKQISDGISVKVLRTEKIFKEEELLTITRLLQKEQSLLDLMGRKGLSRKVLEHFLGIENVDSLEYFQNKDNLIKLSEIFQDFGLIFDEIDMEDQYDSYRLKMRVHARGHQHRLNFDFQFVHSPEFKMLKQYFNQLGELADSEFEVTYKNEPPKRVISKEFMFDMINDLSRKGFQLTRFKGLGEMNPEQLWDTTLNPEKRTFLKVTIEDAIEAGDVFTVLMGDEVEPRRRFIEDNALNVRNLDI